MCSQLWCRLHLQENGKTNCEILHSFVVIIWNLKSLAPFLFILFPLLTHHSPNLLRSFVLSPANKSSFPPKSSALLKYLCFFYCMRHMWWHSGYTGECTHRCKCRRNALEVPVFLTRQLTHFPITGSEKIIITHLCFYSQAELCPICRHVKSAILLKIHQESFPHILLLRATWQTKYFACLTCLRI